MHTVHYLWPLAALTALACVKSAPPQAPRATLEPLCGDDIEGASALAKPGGMVLLGEMHGTVEIPAFVAALTCQLARGGLPVQVGLELPRQEQPLLDRFLKSSGGPAAQEALLEGEFWQREVQDGRSSQAQLALLDSLRQQRAAGLPVEVFAFDDREITGQEPRERAMADAILKAHQKAPKALTLVLVGNLHARTKPGAHWDPDFLFTGAYLAREVPEIISLDAAYEDGDAWVCIGAQASDCGVCKVRGNAPEAGLTRKIHLSAAMDERGFSGFYAVGALTASPPARGN